MGRTRRTRRQPLLCAALEAGLRELEMSCGWRFDDNQRTLMLYFAVQDCRTIMVHDDDVKRVILKEMCNAILPYGAA